MKWHFHQLKKSARYQETMTSMRQLMAEGQTDAGHLLLYEYTPIVTLTRSTKKGSLLSSEDALYRDGIEAIRTDRGGDITFHGPGQLVGYPIIKLCSQKTSETKNYNLLGYVRWLEDRLIDALQSLGVTGLSVEPGFTGVWRNSKADPVKRKIVQIGVGVNGDGMTRHGFAINNDMDFSYYFKHIIPCGIEDRPVSSLKEEGYDLTLERLSEAVCYSLEKAGHPDH